MSGETQANESGWTVDTLKIYTEQLSTSVKSLMMDRLNGHFIIDNERFAAIRAEIKVLMDAMEKVRVEADKRYQQRYESQQEGLITAMTAQEKAVGAALLSAERAVTKAELAAEKRFEAVNEFRGQLTDQAATFMPRSEAENRMIQNAEKIEAVEKRTNEALAVINSRLDTTSGQKSQMTESRGINQWTVGFIISMIFLGIAIGGFAITLATKIK